MMKKIGLSGKGKLDFYCEIYLNSRGLSVLSNSRLMLGVINKKVVRNLVHHLPRGRNTE